MTSPATKMILAGKPTIEFCEKAGDGIIARPFYALSNLAYLAVGVLILIKGRGSRLSRLFGSTAILIGLLSFTYDATYTYWSQLLDLLGMLIFINLLIYLNNKKTLAVQIFLVLAGMISIYYFKSFAGEFVFGFFILWLILQELRLRKTRVNFGLWLQALALFILAFIIWIPDAVALWCDPNDIVNGRSVFHILTSITIYLLYRYYQHNHSA